MSGCTVHDPVSRLVEKMVKGRDIETLSLGKWTSTDVFRVNGIKVRGWSGKDMVIVGAKYRGRSHFFLWKRGLLFCLDTEEKVKNILGSGYGELVSYMVFSQGKNTLPGSISLLIRGAYKTLDAFPGHDLTDSLERIFRSKKEAEQMFENSFSLLKSALECFYVIGSISDDEVKEEVRKAIEKMD